MKQQAINLLKQLISTPSFSREEDKTAEIITIIDKIDKIGLDKVVDEVAKLGLSENQTFRLKDFLSTTDINEIELFLVTDFLKPATLIDAKTATYLISPAVQSPMGANLSAFATKDAAKKFIKKDGDHLSNWQEIQNKSFK